MFTCILRRDDIGVTKSPRDGFQSNEVEGTALFIEKIVTMWKILNVRSKNIDVRRMDPLVAVVEAPDDPRLTFLLEMAKKFSDMDIKTNGAS